MALPLNKPKMKWLPNAPVVKEKATREDKYIMVFFLVAIFGGALRKWFIDSGVVGNLVLLLQMSIPFVMAGLSKGSTISPFARYGILGVYFLYLVLQVFNPLQVSLFHGILGIMVHGIFWIGIFFYISNRHLFRPERYLKWLLPIVAFEIGIAFVQYTLPETHVLNKYAHDAVKGVATIADGVRVSGTFSYLSGYTAFLLFYPFFVWALIRLHYPTYLVALAVIFGSVAGFMTGSRSTMAIYSSFIGFILLHSYPLGKVGSLIGRLIIPVAVFITVAQLFPTATITQKINKAYTNFAERVTVNRARGEEAERLTWDLSYFQYSARFRYPITGIGTGATYQGATILFGASPEARAFGYVESEFVKIVLEGGVIIVMLRIALATLLVFQLSFTNRVLRFGVWFCLVYAAPTVFNVHNATFIMLGLILIDNIIWRQNQQVISDKEAPNDHITIPIVPQPLSTSIKDEVFRGYPQIVNQPSKQ